jgi:soluble lytic murein transglycosylase
MLSKKSFTAVMALALALAAGLPPAAAQAPSAPSRADQVLLDMGQAFGRGERARLQALLPQAKGHPLEPWAAYWELRNRLGEASTAEVQAFLRRWAGTYQEDRLRNDWLLVLGQRRDWPAFVEHLAAFRMNDDREVRCYALLVEHLKAPKDTPAQVVEDVRRLWHGQREADDGCKTAAERLHGARLLSAEQIWRKARIAMEANRAQPARDAVEIVAPDAVKHLAAVQGQPAKFLDDKKFALTRKRKELITLALVRLAATDPAAAAEQLRGKWSLQLTAEERHWVWGVIGKQAALRLDPQALAYFERAGRDESLTDDMLAWKARAALRAGSEPNWRQVLSATEAMSEEARRDATWVYWRAKALMATAGTDASGPSAQRTQALLLLQSIASIRGFYEQLALEELGQRVSPPARPAPLTAEEREAARDNPGLQRALYAIGIGLRNDGVREWNYTVNLHRPGGLPERELLAAAQLACERAVWDRCINTSERTRGEMDMEQRFPMPYRDLVLKRTREIGLDPAYVYGLIRQESRFIMDARSHVGASGLMQIMPATARETARHIGLTSFTAEQINHRETNILIGTAYLKRALDDFGGSMALAAAAYNAGPSRPRAWRNGPVLDAAIWAENVPFSETRDYVKKVLSNATVYAALLSGQPQSLRERLGQVGPRAATAPPVDERMP